MPKNNQKIMSNSVNGRITMDVALQEQTQKTQALANLARKSTNPKELEKLAKEKSRNVKFWVASNLNTPEETLRELFETDSYSILGSLAGNPNTPIDIIAKLCEYEDDYIGTIAKSRFDKYKQQVFELWKD